MSLFSFLNKLFIKNAQPQTVEKIYFGLGNPGTKYHNTRHNVGFRVLDELSTQLAGRKSGNYLETQFESGILGGKDVALVKPLTFMNRSGDAVELWMKKYNVNIANTLIIVDDFNIPLGSIRLRRGGSHGGHNGLKSIISKVGEDFPRLRVGIGPLPSKVGIIDFVLSDFSEQEEEKLRETMKKAAEAILFFQDKGVEAAMNLYNK